MITADKNDVSESSIIKFAKKLCRSEAFPMVIVDEQLICVYSPHPKLLPVGTELSSLLFKEPKDIPLKKEETGLSSLMPKEPIEIPLKNEKDVVLKLNDAFYCARFIPINDKYSFCQFMGVSEIMDLASYTNLYFVMAERLFMLEECADNIKKYIEQLNGILPPKAKLKSLKALDVDAESSKLKYLINRLSDYLYVTLSPNKEGKVIDARDMINYLINCSNKILMECGKYLEFISEEDVYFIQIGQRYAVTALINAMQNALLYSPIDDDPIVSLTKSIKDNRKYIVVQIINNIDNYTAEPDLILHRCGLGIPVIRKFVQRADGEFYFEKNGSKARVGIMIPEYIPGITEEPKFESGGFKICTPEEKTVITELMEDVVSCISKKKKRH